MRINQKHFLSGALWIVFFLVGCQPGNQDNSTADINEVVANSSNAITSAVTVKTEFAEIDGRRIAFRRFGEGPAMILCNRFRGTLDSWDPLFLDSLSNHFQVITFDYSGIGRSTLKDPADSLSEVKDVVDLVSYFKLDTIVLLGWSHGGKVAQMVAAYHPDLVSHLILLGTGPLGPNPFPPEKIFFDRALKPVNDLDDEIILFFEPASDESIAAAKRTHDRIAQRVADKDIDVPVDVFQKYFNSVAVYNADINARETLKNSAFPILVLSGDHDIVLPVENWYALNRIYKQMFIVTFPSSGHAPHHQHPLLAVQNILSFIQQVPNQH